MHPSDRTPRPPRSSRTVGRVPASSTPPAVPSLTPAPTRTSPPCTASGTPGISDFDSFVQQPTSAEQASNAAGTEDSGTLGLSGPAALVSSLVSAAAREFGEGYPERANLFLRLVHPAVTHPGRTWRQAGQLHFDHGRFEEAGLAFGQAAAFFPSDVELQVRLARTCLHLGDVPNFEGYLQRALTLNPAHPAAIELVADVNRDHGDPAFAARLYARLLRSRDGRRLRHRRRALAECCWRLGPAATVATLCLGSGGWTRSVAPWPSVGPAHGIQPKRRDPSSAEKWNDRSSGS